MRRNLVGALLLAAGLGTAVLWAATMSARAQALTAAQVTALDRLMRQKLDHSQGILAAVVTSNWSELEQHSQALAQIPNDMAWTVLRTPEYVRYSEAFVRASQDLVDAAKRKDLDEAPLAYVSLTLSCVQCHRYVARARLAGSR